MKPLNIFPLKNSVWSVLTNLLYMVVLLVYISVYVKLVIQCLRLNVVQSAEKELKD